MVVVAQHYTKEARTAWSFACIMYGIANRKWTQICWRISQILKQTFIFNFLAEFTGFLFCRLWAAKKHDAHWDFPRQQQAWPRGPLLPWRAKRRPEEAEEEEEQGVVAYLVCPVIVFKVKSLIRNRVRRLQWVAKRVPGRLNGRKPCANADHHACKCFQFRKTAWFGIVWFFVFFFTVRPSWKSKGKLT